MRPMMPAHEPDRTDTNVLQYSTAEKLFLMACSENAITEAIALALHTVAQETVSIRR